MSDEEQNRNHIKLQFYSSFSLRPALIQHDWITPVSEHYTYYMQLMQY